MNGKVARSLRKDAFALWSGCSPEKRKKVTKEQVYDMMKKTYKSKG